MGSDEEERRRERRRSRNFEENTKESRPKSNLNFWLLASLALVTQDASSLYGYKNASTKFDLRPIMTSDYELMESIKQRPVGIRYRDDASLMRFSYSQNVNAVRDSVVAMPLMVERQNPSLIPDMQAHSSHSEPSLEDIELIDVLWREDIAAEKGSLLLQPADQYEQDLQLLTEKSIFQPLTRAETSRYEEMAKGYFEDFYCPCGPGRCTSAKSVDPFYKREVATPTDEDLDALLEDVNKETSELNQLSSCAPEFLEPIQQPLINNVSLSQGIVFNQNNVSDLVPVGEEQQVPTALSSPTTITFNSTEADPWTNSTLAPNDIFPTAANQAFPAFPPNETDSQMLRNRYPYDYGTHRSVYDYDHYSRRTASSTFSNDSSSSVSSSPRTTSASYNSEAENVVPSASRYYGKLAPQRKEYFKEESTDTRAAARANLNLPPLVPTPAAEPRRRGRQSKDEQLAASNNLPLTAKEIAEMKLPDLQKLLKHESLTEAQKALIKKIRRRGKNKVAARTCRQRRGDRSQAEQEPQQMRRKAPLNYANENGRSVDAHDEYFGES